MSSNKHFSDLDITKNEFENISKALKNDEFKKLFFDYCQEIQDPENRKRYEEEIKQLEAERGVDVVFLNPEPGFVVKTSVDGEIKCFVNIAKSDKIDKPSNAVKFNKEIGKKALSWSIPYAQAPPRNDVDNKGVRCVVYDVLFHPDALYLSEKNSSFRKHLIETACDAVEREFNAKLDRANLKFPKLNFKGVPRPTVIRKISNNPPSDSHEPSPIDGIYPPLPPREKPTVKIVKSNSKTEPLPEYTTPKYVIKHRRSVDMSEMTNELDAKLNMTIPTELVVEIDLPLLKSTADCTLDVTEKTLHLISETPAKYKLKVDLPFAVNDKNGSAKFDTNDRKLRVSLPVCREGKQRNMKDLCREDSGVESDARDDLHSLSSNSNCSSLMDSPIDEKSVLIEVLAAKDNDKSTFYHKKTTSHANDLKSFLKDSIHYNFPQNFDCNVLDNNLAIVLHVKNVDPQSIETIRKEKFVYAKFTSIGSGYYPTHYAFFFELDGNDEAEICSVETEAWDNNVILSLSFENAGNLQKYSVGLEPGNLKEYQLKEKLWMPSKKPTRCEANNNSKILVNRKNDDKTTEIEVKALKTDNVEEEDHKPAPADGKKSNACKKQKKKNKKRRSYSESSCADMQSSDVTCVEPKPKPPSQNKVDNEKNSSESSSPDRGDETQSQAGRKQRSYSECRDAGTSSFKGILKHYSRYDRNVSISESCSSIDEQSSYSCSIDAMRKSGSFSEIPEESDSQSHEMSESCKKTVRFNEVIRKQLFRLDSSILGQRKKNQKRKNQKQRAQQRRNSEGDSADYEQDNNPKPTRPTPVNSKKDKKSSQWLMFDMEM